jgi:hypothetical protein
MGVPRTRVFDARMSYVNPKTSLGASPRAWTWYNRVSLSPPDFAGAVAWIQPVSPSNAVTSMMAGLLVRMLNCTDCRPGSKAPMRRRLAVPSCSTTVCGHENVGSSSTGPAGFSRAVAAAGVITSA